jgi:hypothetical protein
MNYRGDQSLFSKFVQAFAAQIQNLENATWDTMLLRRIDVATGAQLDSLGEIVGETRQGKIDADYKIAILAKIQMNASCGEPERLIAAVKALTGATVVEYQDIFPATVYINFESDTVVSDQLYNYLQRLLPAGVRLILTQSDDDDTFMFASGSSSESDSSHGFADLTQTTGGKLSNLLS